MTAHHQFADDLALYALGALHGDERDMIEQHLEECSACRRELQHLRGDMALMALSTAGPKPPQRARQRLMDAVAREPRESKARLTPVRPRWWTPLPWFAAATLALAAMILWIQNSDMQQRISGLENESAQQQAQLARAQAVLETLTASDAKRVTITPVTLKTPPPPEGKVIYVRDRSSLIFLASNLPALPRQKAYELWLIPLEGAPIPAGVFTPDAHGSATVVNPPLPSGVEAKAFAITVEPETGSTTPTMPIVMMGAGE
jgi:anti-sigma-K factor RskA